MRGAAPVAALLVAVGVASAARAEGLVFVEAGGEPEPPPEGATVKTKRPALRVDVGALLQVEAGGEPAGPSGLVLRRTRLVADAELEKVLHLALHLELEVNPRATLVDAPLAEAWMGFDAASRALADIGRLRVGQLEVPFGRELEDAAEDFTFAERSAGSRCLGPGMQERDGSTPDGRALVTLGEATGRDVGLRYDLALPLGATGLRLDAAAGLFAGGGPNRLSATAPLYAGRVALARGDFHDRARLSVEIGAGYAYAGARPIRDRCVLPFAAASTVADLHRADAYARLRWRWLTLAVEGLAATLETGRLDAFALAGTAAVEPLPQFLEIAVRVEDYEDQRALLLTPRGEAFVALTAGATLKYWGERFRLSYQYERRFYRSGQSDEDGHLISFLMLL